MKNVLRTLGLVALVSLTWLSNAHAGTCTIICGDGTRHSFSASSGSACCSQIDSICPNGASSANYNGQQCAL
jgi:hypothetical protein